MENETQTKKEPLITPVLAWFMAAMVLANTAGAMQGMLLPLYVKELGATIKQVGLVFTLANIVAAPEYMEASRATGKIVVTT